MSRLARGRDFLGDSGLFALYVARRFAGDRCVQVAASLTYTSLLAMVPLMALGLSLIAAFPGFGDARGEIENFLFENFLPESVAAMQEHVNRFAANAGKLSAFGLVGLAIIAVMLLFTIEGAFNQIWRARQKRPLLTRLGAFWAVLTLAPFLFGLSLSLSSYLFALARASVFATMPGSSHLFAWGLAAKLTPSLFALGGFALLYFAIPNQAVRWRHALIGAAVATALFAALQSGFGFYIRAFPTFQAIYGALSVIPILLVWTYLVWTIALLGAVVTASLPDWRYRAARNQSSLPGRRLGVALAILAELSRAHGQGASLRRVKLLAAADAPAEEEEAVLDVLQSHGYALRVGRDRWHLGRDLAQVTLHDLAVALGLAPIGIAQAEAGPTWQRRLGELLDALDRQNRASLDVAIAEIVGETAMATDAPRLARIV